VPRVQRKSEKSRARVTQKKNRTGPGSQFGPKPSRVGVGKRQSRIRRRPVVQQLTTFVGLDTSKKYIDVCVLLPDRDGAIQWRSPGSVIPSPSRDQIFTGRREGQEADLFSDLLGLPGFLCITPSQGSTARRARTPVFEIGASSDRRSASARWSRRPGSRSGACPLR
jgi:hypothetical protein